MARANIYIRKSNQEYWDSLKNKSDIVNAALELAQKPPEDGEQRLIEGQLKYFVKKTGFWYPVVD